MAIKECQSAGIQVKMITGDHAATASAIAAQMGIGNGHVLTGIELENLSVSTVFLAGIFGVFEWGMLQGYSTELSRTLSINTLVTLEVWYLFSSRYVHGSSLTTEGIRGTKAVFFAIGLVGMLQAAFTYLSPIQFLFKTEPLNFHQIAVIALIGMVGFIIFEVDKLILLKFSNNK
ncbi:MAG: hypothetical protein A3F13_09805 [Gammaproteobacteria bacterium RIFCSPHIGHO2_12_FULL_40_19]|nr:MAG: hypothetical protein A3F13_09805 [Gammaproteobacteria bacterium RIFCSPHIGHO2_12_FULL_40_19]